MNADVERDDQGDELVETSLSSYFVHEARAALKHNREQLCEHGVDPARCTEHRPADESEAQA